MPRSCRRCFWLPEQRIELAGALECVEFVATADVPRVDEDLRYRGTSVRPLDHLLPHRAIRRDVDLTKVDPLARKQFLRPVAIGAVLGRVDFDRSHNGSLILSNPYMDVRTGSATLANTSTSTLAAPARSSALAQPSTVAPDVSTSSTRTRRRPSTAAFPSGGTRNAPCTLAARSDRDSPTCVVALTRLSAPAAMGMPLAAATAAASM